TVPVLGNGDIFAAEDALEMMAGTGGDGVVIGRGCQGRPWLFGDLANALNGSEERHRPGLAEVGRAVYKHGQYLVDHFEDEFYGVRDLRKHIAWYFKGYPVGGELRSQLAMVSSLDELAGLLSQLAEDARPGRSGRTCPRAGWTPASSTPAGNRCCRRPNSTSLEDENALRHSPAHLGADGDRGGLFAMGRRAVGERTGEESTSLGLPA